MSGVQIVKIVSSCSLALLFATLWATDYRELSRKIEGLRKPADVSNAILEEQALVENDVELQTAANDLGSEEGEYTVEEVKAMVSLRAEAESSPLPSTSSQIKEIKSSPLYRDPGVQDQSNWLDGAIKRLLELIPKPQPRNPVGSMSLGAVPNFIIPIIWFLLAAAVVLFGYFAIRHFQWRSALKRKSKAMLEEDEPERTLDEWLAQADQLAQQGRYREAVRAMYLSCLLKFDEANVARFIRAETNWEHLNRIQMSSRRPPNIDFLPPTRAFDNIWYGHHVRGQQDVDEFKAWYQEITAILREAKR